MSASVRAAVVRRAGELWCCLGTCARARVSRALCANGLCPQPTFRSDGYFVCGTEVQPPVGDGGAVDAAAAKAAGEQNKLVFSKADFASGCLAKRDDGTTCVWTYPLNEVRGAQMTPRAHVANGAQAAADAALAVCVPISTCGMSSGWMTRTRWLRLVSTSPCST